MISELFALAIYLVSVVSFEANPLGQLQLPEIGDDGSAPLPFST